MQLTCVFDYNYNNNKKIFMYNIENCISCVPDHVFLFICVENISQFAILPKFVKLKLTDTKRRRIILNIKTKCCKNYVFF